MELCKMEEERERVRGRGGRRRESVRGRGGRGGRAKGRDI